MNIKVNRRDWIEVDNIKKIVYTSRNVKVYKKDGSYPHAIISEGGISSILLRLVNAGVDSEKIQEIKDGIIKC